MPRGNHYPVLASCEQALSTQKWYLSVWTVDNSNPRFGFAHSWDCHHIVTLLMVWKDYIQFLQWILYKIIELQVGKGILLIFEMCAVIAWNRNFMSLSLTIYRAIGPLITWDNWYSVERSSLFSGEGGHTSIHLTGMFV